jgi:branched-chain amino acid transport system permease protein
VFGVALFLRGNLVLFGQALFYAVGAYTVAFAAKQFHVREVLLLVPLGTLLAAAVAAAAGLFVTRYRDIYFAMLNLGLAMLFYALVVKLYSITAGTDGIGVGTPTLAGVPLPRESFRYAYYYLTLASAGAAYYAIHRFGASPLGHYLRAFADNEVRIEYSGIAVHRVVYRSYVFAGALGGLAGTLVALTVGHVVPDYGFWHQSGEFIFAALLGGFASPAGPLIGSLAFEFIRAYASKWAPEGWQLILGAVMLAVILYRPGGLYALYEAWARRRRDA